LIERRPSLDDEWFTGLKIPRLDVLDIYPIVLRINLPDSPARAQRIAPMSPEPRKTFSSVMNGSFEEPFGEWCAPSGALPVSVTTAPWGRGKLSLPGLAAGLLYAFLMKSSDGPK